MAIYIIAGFLVISALVVAMFKHAEFQYNEIGNALKFAVYSATFDGEVSGQTKITASEVLPYFEYALAKETGSTCQGGGIPCQFSGGCLTSPLVVESLTQLNPGDSLPNGTVVTQPGFLVTASVPVFPYTVMDIKPFSITMTRFAVCQPVPILK